LGAFAFLLGRRGLNGQSGDGKKQKNFRLFRLFPFVPYSLSLIGHSPRLNVELPAAAAGRFSVFNGRYSSGGFLAKRFCKGRLRPPRLAFSTLRGLICPALWLQPLPTLIESEINVSLK